MGYKSIKNEEPKRLPIWKHINFRRRKFYEHIEKCGILKNARDPWQEVRLVQDEIEYSNLDLDFVWSDTPTIQIHHACTWVDCPWSWKSTIEFSTNIENVLYESPVVEE
jgi:hypothetical protein